MMEIVFLLEEYSAQAMLEGLLPRVLPKDIKARFIAFEGKQDLEKQLARKIRGYRNPQACFIVLRDQDSHPDCKTLKSNLMVLCQSSGRTGTLIRIACTELESFYLADLAAVEQGLGIRGLARQQNIKKYRQPDYLGSPSAELAKLTKGLYQKISGSRAIAPFLDLDNSRSNSFSVLVSGIRRVIAMAQNGDCR